MTGSRRPRPGRSRAPAISADLVLEEVDPAGQLARVDRELGERGPVRPPALDHVGHRRARRSVPPERVEQVALPALVEEPLLVVLAVDLDERPDLVGEPRRGRREVVEPRAGAAAGRHLADDDERLREPVEERLDARGFGAVPDDAGVGARAADEPERVDERGSCRRPSRR